MSTQLIWQGKRALNTYKEKPCGDDTWQYVLRQWSRNEFDVRVILDSEGGLRSEYLADTVTPDAMKPSIEKWVALYRNNHVDVLEACLLDFIKANASHHLLSVDSAQRCEQVERGEG